MQSLLNIGFSLEEIKIIFDQEYFSFDEVLLDILKNIGCQERHIKNIILSNPLFLKRSVKEINDLINKLKQLGITHLETTLESNPWILNKSIFDIENYIIEQKKLGLSIEEIIDKIDSEIF